MSLLTTPPMRGSRRAPFALLVAMTACGTLGMHVIIPALPAMAAALNMSISAAQLTITLYLIGLAVGQLAYGPISEIPLHCALGVCALQHRRCQVGMSLRPLDGGSGSERPRRTSARCARLLQSVINAVGLLAFCNYVLLIRNVVWAFGLRQRAFNRCGGGLTTPCPGPR